MANAYETMARCGVHVAAAAATSHFAKPVEARLSIEIYYMFADDALDW